MTRSGSTRTSISPIPTAPGRCRSPCDPLIAGRYLCDVLGNRLTSSIGASLVWDTLNNRIRPSSGERFVLSTDFAGLGGDVRYLRARISAAKYWNVFGGFIFSLTGEAGYIHSLENGAPNVDPVRLTDRFFLGNPQIRGFDIRGVGPRIQRQQYLYDYDTATNTYSNVRLNDDPSTITDDAIGGRAYYVARAELEIPLGASVRELGLRPSIYIDAGAVFGVRTPAMFDITPGSPLALAQCTNDTTGVVTPLEPRAGACPDRHDPHRRRPHGAVSARPSSATRQAPASRSASGSTGTRPSGRSASTSPVPCSASRATTPNFSAST